MNSVFHYFTVKTLCHYADINPEKAQDIAFYSQLVDDFNYTWLQPGNAFLVAGKPPKFFVDNHLTQPYSQEENTWWFYPATTGISLLQSASSMINSRAHQLLTIIPFHFIPMKPLTETMNREEDWICRKAGRVEDDKGSFINQLLYGFYQKNNPSDMELGMLLHIYADTYSHQNFSGRLGTENDVRIKKITHVGATYNQNPEPSSMWPWYPSLGHAKASHVPDVCAFKFTAEFINDSQGNKHQYTRNNLEEFLTCAYNIWEMLNIYNGQIGIDPNIFISIAEKIRQAFIQCVDGTSEFEDTEKIKKIWQGVFHEIDYSYYWDDMWGLTYRTDLTIAPSLRGIYDVSDDFYKFNQFAYEHIYRVVGKYREELL